MTKNGFFLEQYKGVQGDNNWFKNLKFLGKGGNGTAFLVQGTAGPLRGGIFTLKIFHMMRSESRQKRFVDEVGFLKRSNHPNLMRHLDEGIYAGHPFVVQDYMPKTLHNEMDGKPIEFGRALLYSCQLLSAVQALHSDFLIHRDIKPQNIFVDNLNVYLGDFGLLKKVGQGVDEDDRADFEGYIAMPRFYRTPELVRYAAKQGGLDLGSDIFQLGLVIAQMFTGRNILKPAENRLDPIELEKVGHINGKHGGLVAKTISEMCKVELGNRCTIDAALSRLASLVETYAREYEEFHGVSFIG